MTITGIWILWCHDTYRSKVDGRGTTLERSMVSNEMGCERRLW